MGTRVELETHTNYPIIIQTPEWYIRVAWCEHDVLKPPPLTTSTHTMSSSSNLSPSHPGRLNSQQFHWVFHCTLPCHQCNILYAAILQQPSLVIDLERQSSYEEDDSIQSLVRVFHHLCSTQIYLGSLELHTNHVVSSSLHIAAALDDMLALLHDHGFHHHILALPPNSTTLTHIFHPIYHTLTAVERDAYKELDLRLVLLRTQKHCFLIGVGLVFNNTWTGDTHEETNVLPSTGKMKITGDKRTSLYEWFEAILTLIVKG